MISSIARSKNRKVERTRKCDSRGTDGGKPIRSSGSILPMVLKYTPIASRSSSASRPKPSEKIVRSSTSSVSRDASAATSMVVPSLPRQRAVSAAAASIIAGAKSKMVLRAKTGARMRRWVRHCSFSALSRPSPSPAESTRRWIESFW